MLNNFKIGHFTNRETGTGCTVILDENGAIGGVSVMGSAPGTRETDLLRSENTVNTVNAVVLSGGSAFGLEASSGVMRYLAERGVGYNTGTQLVPIVVGAVLYDLDYKEFDFPDVTAGIEACADARSDNYDSGVIGAGTGATVGKIFGMEHCSKSGLGVAHIKRGELEIVAVVAVNAFGDVYDFLTGEIIAGAKSGSSFADSFQIITDGYELSEHTVGTNTTIGCIMTNASLTKAEANKLAQCTHDAYSICIRPVHTSMDGDTVFVLSDGSVEVNSVTLQTLAVECMCVAIKRAVATAELE